MFTNFLNCLQFELWYIGIWSVETCLKEDYLFVDAQEYPLPAEQEIDHELLQNYFLSFKDWVNELKSDHHQTQEKIHKNFSMEDKQSSIETEIDGFGW